MTIAATVHVSRIVPLFDKQVLMAHVASPAIDRNWLGLVDLRCNVTTFRMRCVGVGETGGEPAVMLRPAESTPLTLEAIVATISEQPLCPLYLECTPEQAPGHELRSNDRSSARRS